MSGFNRLSLTLVVFAVASRAFALPVLPMAEKEGLERLARAEYSADFAKLANHFRTQTDRITCGPTTGAIVLNAMRHNTDKAPLIEIPKTFLEQMPIVKEKKFDPRLHAYTPENFLNAAALKIKTLSRIYAEPIQEQRDPGLQLEQLRQIFAEAHHVVAHKIVVGTKETARNGKKSRVPFPKRSLIALWAK